MKAAGRGFDVDETPKPAYRPALEGRVYESPPHVCVVSSRGRARRHFDSWHTGTGATDNAAGSAVMMEAMRILKASGVKLRHTVRIALWSGEEEGLLGSRAYIKAHFGDPGCVRADSSAGHDAASTRRFATRWRPGFRIVKPDISWCLCSTIDY
jgi:Peptidase family M28